MKNLSLLIFVFILQLGYGQFYSDNYFEGVLEDSANKKLYLINGSNLNDELFPFERDGSDIHLKVKILYQIRNDSLFATDILTSHKDFRKSKQELKLPRFIDASDSLILIELEHSETALNTVKYLFSTINYLKNQKYSCLKFCKGVKCPFVYYDGKEYDLEELGFIKLDYYNYNDNPDGVESILIKAYRSNNETLIYYKQIMDDKPLPLPNGIFDIYLKWKNHELKYIKVAIKSSEVISLTSDDFKLRVSNSTISKLKYWDEEHYTELKYSNSGLFLEKFNPTQHFSLSGCMQSYLNKRKNLALFYTLGFGYQFSNLQNSEDTIKRQVIRGFSLPIGLGMRTYLHKTFEQSKPRMFLEFGSNYNLPLVYRNIYDYKGGIIKERFYFKFNDFSPYFQIGWKNSLSLKVNYHWFNALKPKYGYLPKWEFSIICQFFNSR